MRRTAVLSSLVLVGGLLEPSTALATDDHGKGDGRWLAVKDQFALVLPNGETFTAEEGGEEPSELPPVGTELFISEVLYATADGITHGKEVGRSHLQCTIQVVAESTLCVAALVFATGSQLVISAQVDVGREETQPFDVAVTGGTGEWFGATGAVTITDTSTEEKSSSLYEADVMLPHR